MAPHVAQKIDTRVLEIFLDGAPQITAQAHFTRYRRADGSVDWAGVLAEADWSVGQRALIQLAAALCGASTPRSTP